MTMTSPGGITVFLKAVFVFMIYRHVQSELIVKPMGVEAVVGGGLTFFNCSTTLSSAEIHWFHYADGDAKDRSFVYGYDQFYSPYLGRYQMEKNPTSGAYDLIIPSVTIADAGRYECQDDAGRGDKASAELTVLDENPVCQSNMKQTGLIGPNICGLEPEELHLTCAVQYHGNQPPIMQWKEEGSRDSIAEGVTRNISSNRVIYYLQIEVTSRIEGSSFQCVTTRSATSQFGCTAGIVTVAGYGRTLSILVIFGVSLCILVVSVIGGWIAGQKWQRRRTKIKGSIGSQPYEPVGRVTETIELNQLQDNEAMKNLIADNKRLVEKVTEIEKLLYSTDSARYRTTSSAAHTIKTKAAETATNAPVTGMTILGNNLFVISRKYPDVEVYDAETFVFQRFLQAKEITNPVDIASSKEIQCLYVINREESDVQLKSEIIKLSIVGETGKYWITEDDDGRLSTYESNLIVCFSTKRVINEYSPEGVIRNTIRLSPGAGFNQLWHAIKLTGTNFVVCHSKMDGRQRVCIVDTNGSILIAFEELPTFMFRMDIPICSVADRDKYMFVADTSNNRVLLFNLTLKFEGVLLKTDDIPVRLCLNESEDRVFVGVNCGKKKLETWKDGHILIYNIRK